MPDDDVQKSISELLASGYPDIDVRRLRHGEYELLGYGVLWYEASPKLGYGILRAQPSSASAERFEFFLGDHSSLLWAISAAVAYLMNPHEGLSTPASGYRP